MSNTQSVATKERISQIFLRKGGEGVYTRLFENLPVSQQEMLMQKVPLEEDEVPLIGGYKNQQEYILLTSIRIAWQCEEAYANLLVTEVVDAMVDFDEMVVRGLNMSTVKEIQIKTKVSGNLILKMEAGAPLVGVWNVLLHFGWRNTKPLTKN